MYKPDFTAINSGLGLGFVGDTIALSGLEAGLKFDTSTYWPAVCLPVTNFGTMDIRLSSFSLAAGDCVFAGVAVPFDPSFRDAYSVSMQWCIGSASAVTVRPFSGAYYTQMAATRLKPQSLLALTAVSTNPSGTAIEFVQSAGFYKPGPGFWDAWLSGEEFPGVSELAFGFVFLNTTASSISVPFGRMSVSVNWYGNPDFGLRLSQ